MFGDILYNRLPEIYKVKDNNLQLKAFLNILGVGFDEFYTYTQKLKDNFDAEDADASVLSPSIQLLGFKYPHSMTEAEKRSLIKILPVLYLNKGNSKVFEYLARNIFGENSTATAFKEVNASYIGLPEDTIADSLYIIGEALTTGIITIKVTYPAGLADFEARKARYLSFVEIFRPVNCVINYTFIES